MSQRTNHRAAKNLGEVPATQEGENHPNAWGKSLERGGTQRERRQKEWPSFSAELNLKKTEHPDMTGEITKYWCWSHTLLGNPRASQRSPTLGKMLYPSRPGVEAVMAEGHILGSLKDSKKLQRSSWGPQLDLETVGGTRIDLESRQGAFWNLGLKGNHDIPQPEGACSHSAQTITMSLPKGGLEARLDEGHHREVRENPKESLHTRNPSPRFWDGEKRNSP